MTVTIHHEPTGVLLTMDDVRRWKSELREIGANMEKLQARADDLTRKLSAAALFLDVRAVSDDAPDQVPAVAEEEDALKDEAQGATLVRVRRRRRISVGLTWAEVVKRAVEGAEIGMTYAEMRKFAASSELGPKLEMSDKGYHNAIGRLARDGVIVREHGRLFTHKAYQRFMKEVAEGRQSTVVPMPLAHSPMGEAILKIVQAQPGITGKATIAELRKNPEFNATLTPHQTGAYNIIARLAKRRQIVRRDDGGIIPGPDFPKDLLGPMSDGNGALNGKAASAPFAREVAASLFENRSGLNS